MSSISIEVWVSYDAKKQNCNSFQEMGVEMRGKRYVGASKNG